MMSTLILVVLAHLKPKYPSICKIPWTKTLDGLTPPAQDEVLDITETSILSDSFETATSSSASPFFGDATGSLMPLFFPLFGVTSLKSLSVSERKLSISRSPCNPVAMGKTEM